jgi:hypothetical protein
MTPLDALKAGAKTALISFVVVLVGVFSTALPGLVEWASGGAVPDLSAVKGTLFAGVSALAVGLTNAAIRYVQVAGVPFASSLFDRAFGAVPAYPEANVQKTMDSAGLPPTEKVIVRDEAGTVTKRDIR